MMDSFLFLSCLGWTPEDISALIQNVPLGFPRSSLAFFVN